MVEAIMSNNFVVENPEFASSERNIQVTNIAAVIQDNTAIVENM